MHIKNTLLVILAAIIMLPAALFAGCKYVSTAPTAGVARTFVFTQQPAGAIAGAKLTTQPVVSVVDAYGNIVTYYEGTVTLELNDGNGVSGALLFGTTTLTAVSGVAAFTDLAINTAGSGYSFTATGPGLTPVTSNAFDVAASGTTTPPTSTSAATTTTTTTATTATATSTVPTTTSGQTFQALAALGQTVFTNICSTCHGASGQGGVGPALWGPNAALGTYIPSPNAQAMLTFISAYMPLSAPGTLSAAQYTNVLCYILIQNQVVSASAVFNQSQLVSITFPP